MTEKQTFVFVCHGASGVGWYHSITQQKPTNTAKVNFFFKSFHVSYSSYALLRATYSESSPSFPLPDCWVSLHALLSFAYMALVTFRAQVQLARIP